jgi:hypothetical protein
MNYNYIYQEIIDDWINSEWLREQCDLIVILVKDYNFVSYKKKFLIQIVAQ